MKTMTDVLKPCKMIASGVILVMTLVARAECGWMRLAASDSTAEAKSAADFVCTGTNDEVTIQKAIDACKKAGCQLRVFAGLYRLDSVRDLGDGGPKAAVCFRNMHREFAFVGERRQLVGWPDDMTVNGIVFCLNSKALEGAEGKSVDIFRGEWSDRGIMNGSALRLENISVWAPDSRHPLRAIDLQRVNSAEIRNVSMRAFGMAILRGLKYPYGQLEVPHPENIGMTLTDGSNNAPVNLVNVSANGFGQGIQVGGEHVVLINCSATFGRYGFTFGNYPYHCAFNHPITLINCCDEQNVNMPLFASCGDNGGALHGRQEVTMISFNFERVAAHVPGKKLGDLMRETRPGTWCGQIGFTTQPKWHAINAVDLPLWAEDGSGRGFRTVNNAHKPACGTAERLSYYPQYMQHIFDTDLNKLLICTDPKTRKWVDANGVEADK